MVATTETKHACFLRRAECRLPCTIKGICRASRLHSRHDENTPAEAEAIARILDESVPDAPITVTRFAHQIPKELLPTRSVHFISRVTDRFCEVFKGPAAK